MCKESRKGMVSMSNFYFNSSGMLTFTNGGSNVMSSVYNSLYPTSDSSSSSSSAVPAWKQEALKASGIYASNDGSTSSFSDEMKKAAQSASGKLSSDDKKAIRNSNGNYLRIAAAQARLDEIKSRQPKTYNYSDDDWVEDMVQDYLNKSSLTSFVPSREYYNIH